MGGQVGRVVVTVREADGDGLLPCRAWVDFEGKRHFQPADASCTPYPRDRSFSCEGRFEIEVPAGRATIHVERGKEYPPVEAAVDVKPGVVTPTEIRLTRWVNMRQEGWYSSDMHVHFGADRLEVLKQLARADDVNWLPVFSYWNDFHEKWPAWPHGSSVSAGDGYLVTLANEEIERIGGDPYHSVGAIFIFGIEKPVYVQRHDKHYPCDAALAKIAKRTTPSCVIDTDKPLWAENVVTMGLGLFDSVQVCHNHYHRDHDLPMGWGMIGAEIEDEARDWGSDELMIRTNMIYYRWLNCGFRLAVSGGAAMGVMPVPLGHSRTYAKLDGPLTEANYLKALQAGRTFATSGPMLTMTVDGHEVGDVISRQSSTASPLKVRVQLRSVEPIDSLELVHDGRVIRQISLAGQSVSPVLDRRLEGNLTPQRSGWVAARAVYRAPTGRLRQAHTSPVYLLIDGKPIAYRRDAEYMIRWINRITDVSNEPNRYERPSDQAESQALFLEARAVYERIAATARQAWGD